MSKKILILLLSLSVVIFSAVSAFALMIEENVEESYEALSTASTEGYNYRTRIVADLDGQGEAGDVIWEVIMETSSDNWLKWKTDASDSKIIVLEGVLPAFDGNDHNYSVIAHVSGDIDNPQPDDYEGDDWPEYISGDIASDPLEFNIVVNDNEYTVGTYSSLVTITPADGVELNTVSSAYDVTVEAIYNEGDEYTDEYYSATFDVDESDVLATVSIPSWLSFSVPTPKRISYFDDALIKYQIKAKSPLPRGDREAVVLVPAYPYDTDTYDSNIIVGWRVKYIAPSIVLTAPSATEISMKYGTQQTLSIPYTTVKPVDVAFNTNQMEIVSWNKPTATSGTLNIVVTPVALSGDVEAKLIVYDDNEKSADIDFKFTIAESIAVSPDVIAWSAPVERESTKTLNLLTSDRPVSYTASPTIPSSFNFTVESDDKTITLGLNPDTANQTYSGTLTFYNSENSPAAVALNIVTVEAILISEDIITIPSYGADMLETDPGILHLENSVVPVSYDISPAPSSKLYLEVLYGEDADEEGIINVRVSPSEAMAYEGVLTFYDENGCSDSVNLRVTKTMSTPSGSSSSVTTYPGEGNKAVTLTVGDYFGEVNWTVGDLPSGVNAELTSDTGASTTLNVYIDDDFAGDLGDYSFTVMAEDAAGQQVTFTINVTVNEIPKINFGEYVSAVSLDARFSKDIEVSFDTVAPVSWEFAEDSDTDIEGLVSFDVKWEISSTDSNAGNFSVAINPTSAINTDAGVKGDIYEVILAVTDANNQVVNLPVGIKIIIPSITIQESSAILTATAGGNAASKTLTLLADENSEYDDPVIPVSYEFPNSEPDEQFNFAVASDDSSITLSITPSWPGLTFEDTIVFHDVFGNSSEIDLTLDSSASGDIEIISDTTDIQITAGQSSDVTLRVNNAYGTVNWIVGTIPEWLNVTPLSGTGNSFTFTIDADKTASGSYSFNIEAEDGAGRTVTYTIKGDVNVPELALTNVPDTITAVYGKTTTETFVFSGAPIVSYDMNDISDNVTVSVSYPENTESGNITLKITPVTTSDGEYSLTLKFSDDFGHEIEALITVEVIMPKLVISEDSAEITPNLNGSDSVMLNLTGDYKTQPLSWSASPVINDSFGFSVTSSDSTITLVSKPSEVANYEGVITFYDEYSQSDSVNLVINVISDEPLSITPQSRNLILNAGASADVTFVANEADGSVTWTASTLNGVTISPTSTTGETATFTITAGSAAVNGGTITITARDSSETASATINITVIAQTSVVPLPTKMDIESDDVIETVLSTLGLSSGEVASLPDNVVGTQRSASDVATEVPTNETLKFVFPLITPSETKVYVFAVDRAKLRENFKNGDAIFVHMKNKNASSSGFNASASEGAKLVDDNGNEITTFPSSGNINVAGLMNAGGSYSTIITSAASAPAPTPSGDDETMPALGSSGGTCNGGFGILALMLSAVLLKQRKK